MADEIRIGNWSLNRGINEEEEEEEEEEKEEEGLLRSICCVVRLSRFSVRSCTTFIDLHLRPH